jgi:hypothetical protein
MGTSCAETRDRTGDLRIFSATLSQLSRRGCCEGQGALVALDQAKRRMLCRCAASGWPSSGAWEEKSFVSRFVAPSPLTTKRQGMAAGAAVDALTHLQAKAGHDKEGFAPCSGSELRLRPAFGRRPTASTRSTKAGEASLGGAVFAFDPRLTEGQARKRLGRQQHLRSPRAEEKAKVDQGQELEATTTEDKPSPRTAPPVVDYNRWVASAAST